MTAGRLGVSLSQDEYNKLKRKADFYDILRNGGDDVPDIDWLMELKPEQLDVQLGEILDARDLADENAD